MEKLKEINKTTIDKLQRRYDYIKQTLKDYKTNNAFDNLEESLIKEMEFLKKSLRNIFEFQITTREYPTLITKEPIASIEPKLFNNDNVVTKTNNSFLTPASNLDRINIYLGE